MDVAQARAVLTMDDGQFQQAAKRAGQTFDQTAKQIEAAGKRAAANVGEALNSLGTRLAVGVTAPLTALGAASIRSATQMDSLKRGLTAVAGSSAEAERQLVRLKEIAKLPGLGRIEAIEMSTQLQAAGLSAKTAERSLLAFGNALATIGKGKVELGGVATALTQITAKGKVTAEEINQIAERVPQIRVAMQAAFGTANTEKLQKMGLTARQFIEGVNNELLKLPRVAGGAQNAFENMQDAVRDLTIAIGQDLLPIVLPILQRLTERATALVQAFGQLPTPVRQAIVVVAALAAAVGPVLLVSGQLITAFGAVKALLPALTTGITGLSLPLKIVAVAVGALAAAWSTNFLGMRTTVTEFVEFVTPYLRGMWEVLKVDFADFVANFKAGWQQVSDWFQNVFITPFQIGVQVIRESLGNIGQAIGEALGPVGEWLGNAAQWILDRVPGLDAVREWFSGIPAMMERFRVIGQRAMDRDAAGAGRGAAAAPGMDLSPVDIGPYAGAPGKTKQRADTPYESQWKAYHQALNAARREQALLQQGASDTAISVANQYSLIDEGRQRTLVGILEEIKSTRDATQMWAQFRTELTAAQVKLKEVSGTDEGGLVGLRKRFQGLIPDDVLTKLLEVNTAIAQHEERVRKAREEQQRIAQVTESLGQQSDQLQRQLKTLLSPAVDSYNFAWQELGLVYDQLTKSQQAMVDSMFNTTRQIEQIQGRMDAFRAVAQGIEGVFYDAFSNISEGFGSFFSSIVGGFQRMLQQMAAQYLASQLANIFTRFLGGMLGANFGGIFKPPTIPTRQHGGYVGTDKPYIVGERGPELIVPRTAGHVVPMAAGAGGPNVTINFHVTASDADSFRRNSPALMADAGAQIRRQMRRDGA